MQWFVAMGMPLALFLWFTIAYFSGLDVNNRYLAEVLVSFNILLWATISFLKVKEEFGLDAFKFTSPCKTLIVAMITGFLIGLLVFVFEFWKGKSYDFPGPYSSIPVFILFVVGSILEEVVWRAYVLRAFGFGWYGLFISSLFFGFHHIGLGFKNFVFATLAGFVLGGVYMKTSLFWGVALGHVLANIVFLQLSIALFKIVVR